MFQCPPLPLLPFVIKKCLLTFRKPSVLQAVKCVCGSMRLCCWSLKLTDIWKSLSEASKEVTPSEMKGHKNSVSQSFSQFLHLAHTEIPVCNFCPSVGIGKGQMSLGRHYTNHWHTSYTQALNPWYTHKLASGTDQTNNERMRLLCL